MTNEDSTLLIIAPKELGKEPTLPTFAAGIGLIQTGDIPYHFMQWLRLSLFLILKNNLKKILKRESLHQIKIQKKLTNKKALRIWFAQWRNKCALRKIPLATYNACCEQPFESCLDLKLNPPPHCLKCMLKTISNSSDPQFPSLFSTQSGPWSLVPSGKTIVRIQLCFKKRLGIWYCSWEAESLKKVSPELQRPAYLYPLTWCRNSLEVSRGRPQAAKATSSHNEYA